MIELTHGKITLALHELQGGQGRPLLHLHALGMHSPRTTPEELEGWPGPVFALDFTGHGESTVPKGGGYTPEILIGDVDAAIEYLGEVTLLGGGLGAYIALLTAGARHDAVRGAVLCDGPGIAGGGPVPGASMPDRIDPEAPTPPDPFALIELSRDVRPPDYAIDFVRMAMSANPHPIAVCARARPDWLQAVLTETGAVPMSIADALKSFT